MPFITLRNTNYHTLTCTCQKNAIRIKLKRSSLWGFYILPLATRKIFLNPFVWRILKVAIPNKT